MLIYGRYSMNSRTIRPLKPGIVLISWSSVTVFRLSLVIVVADVAPSAALVAAVAAGAAFVAAGPEVARVAAVAIGAALVAAVAAGAALVAAAAADGCVLAGVVAAPQAVRMAALTAAITSICSLRVTRRIDIKSFRMCRKLPIARYCIFCTARCDT